MKAIGYTPRVPTRAIDVVEGGGKPRRGRAAFDLDRSFDFSTAALESYAFARWEPVIYDAMVVAASLEYADRTVARPALGWRRDFVIRIPVLEPIRWLDPAVLGPLRDAASFLTGDNWSLDFVQRKGPTPRPPQDYLQLNADTAAVIAFSDGMDSRAVAGLAAEALNHKLVRVRVGSKAGGRPARREPVPFAAVPYAVKASGETSARSRGFKFALISGIAAYLAEADQILLPESGQGAFGPALVTAAHAYPDYRSHPLFTARMGRFLSALLKRPARFVFPRLWYTKGETLKEFAALSGGDTWQDTRSCWRNARHSSLNGRLMQCGVCAACMLRRLSVHAAGLMEAEGIYVCEELTAPSLPEAVHPNFKRMGPAFQEYAIAGTQHLDHMADLILPHNRRVLRRHALLTAPALDLPFSEAETLLVAMFERHAAEWDGFLKKVGARSFLRQWTRAEL